MVDDGAPGPSEQGAGLRIAIIGSRGYPSTYGGFETLVRRLAPYLRDHGDEVTVYCRGRRSGDQLRDGIRCVTTRGLPSGRFSTLSYGVSAALHARRQRYDVALILNVANGHFLEPLAKAGTPTVVNVDGIEWERGKWNRLAKAVFWRGAELTARGADEIVVDSREIGRIWSVEFGRGGVHIPYGADVTVRTEPTRLTRLGLTPGSYALLVAWLVPENNIALFLDALQSPGCDLPAVVVGSAVRRNDPLHSRLRALATARPGFRWLGHVSDQELLRELWENCGVYVHGHSAGGTNPALLQALGHGAPTLALDTPFNQEVLGDESGQLFRPDAAEVARRMSSLVGDAQEQQRLAARGREIVAARYTWPSVLASYRATLHGVVRGGVPRATSG